MTAKASSTSRRGLLVVLQSSGGGVRPPSPEAVAYPLAQATAWDQPIGYVFRRDRLPGDEGPEFFLEVQHHGYRALLPCRQGQRADDPPGLWVLDDGSLWLAPEGTKARVVARVWR